MTTTLKEDVKILVPNKPHKSFSENGEILIKGSEITGEPKYITGMKSGEPFTYRLFMVGENKFIFLNKAFDKNEKKQNNNNNNEDMETTKVTLSADGESNADGGKPETILNLRPAESFSKSKVIGLVVGAAIGFIYCRYKKHDIKATAKYMALGAVVGYVGVYVFDTTKTATLKKA